MEDLIQQTSTFDKITENKSIEFLDIIDKSLDRKIWKHVQKELKRKRSFSEGEIAKNYQSKNPTHNSKRPLRPILQKTVNESEIRSVKHNENKNNIRIQVRFALYVPNH